MTTPEEFVERLESQLTFITAAIENKASVLETETVDITSQEKAEAFLAKKRDIVARAKEHLQRFRQVMGTPDLYLRPDVDGNNLIRNPQYRKLAETAAYLRGILEYGHSELIPIPLEVQQHREVFSELEDYTKRLVREKTEFISIINKYDKPEINSEKSQYTLLTIVSRVVPEDRKAAETLLQQVEKMRGKFVQRKATEADYEGGVNSLAEASERLRTKKMYLAGVNEMSAKAALEKFLVYKNF